MRMTLFSTDCGIDAIVENEWQGEVTIQFVERSGHKFAGVLALLPSEARVLAGLLTAYADEAGRQ